nr:MAG TPA: DNA-directed RNA polymerase II subunit [Caudoviricetes sp.]
MRRIFNLLQGSDLVRCPGCDHRRRTCKKGVCSDGAVGNAGIGI